MPYALKDLPYAFDALEPYIDAKTMETHWSKHHATYINNVNAALDKFPEFKGTGIVELNQLVGEKVPADITRVVRNNGGGHWNHSFFWPLMCSPANSGGPSSALKQSIERDFGSVDEMVSKFNAAAASVFGSGWAWLGYSPVDDRLLLTTTPNQDNPLMTHITETPCIPILGLDVWEHAYYLKYQSRRAEYIAAFWKVVNWAQIESNLNGAKKGIVFSP